MTAGSSSPGDSRMSRSSEGGSGSLRRRERIVRPGEAVAELDARCSLEQLENAHPGLLFQRFPRIFRFDGRRYSTSEALEGFVEDAVGAFAVAGRSGAGRLLEDLHRRLDLVVADPACTRTYRSTWRVACGLGNPHPMENGLSLDPVTGVPVIPGSSVKGVARVGAQLCDAAEEEIDIWFGRAPASKGDPATGVGSVVFFDALPRPWPRLEGDVITRHHDPESLKHSDAPPLESDSPVPVPFLTLAPGTTFVFRIGAADGRRRLPGDWVAKTWEWLDAALEFNGVGAKTSAGYGQLRPSTAARSR